MFSRFYQPVLFFLLAIRYAAAACISSGDETTINNALSAGGSGTIVQLCPSTVILINNVISFTADSQEISTQGYPNDDTRAIIRIASGNTVGTLIQGAFNSNVRLLNVQIDGDRPNNGIQSGAGANIELGGGSTGVVVSHVASRNPRGWSCMHLSESGNTASPCTNVTATYNDIGPCGQEGTDVAGNGQWADGISFACTNSLVSQNTITGSTDGGIVLFNAPGTKVTSNTITSSTTDSGFGAINLVDYISEYGGSFAGVQISNNVITGQKLFNTGIAIGGCAWSFGQCNPTLSGPVTITDNTFSGHIGFSIGINGWTDGLTISGNSVSGVTTPTSSFAEDINCDSGLQSLFSQNTQLIYYPAGLTGPTNLQSNFIAASSNATNFICTSNLLPTSVIFPLSSTLNMGTVAQLHNNILLSYQGDNNLVVYNTSTPGGYTPEWASGYSESDCGSGECVIDFQGDGNLVNYFNGNAVWNTRTAGVGAQSLEFVNQEPWLQILDGDGNALWSTIDGVYAG